MTDDIDFINKVSIRFRCNGLPEIFIPFIVIRVPERKSENFHTKRGKDTKMDEILKVEDTFKIFGENPEKGLSLIKQGRNKDEIFKETGLTVGVQNANFSVERGEVFVIMGLSGSGKSTLVRLLNRLIEPTSGRILIDGQDVLQMKQEELIQLRRKRMSMVFQSFALMPHLTVIKNVAYGLEVAGRPQKERMDRAMAALEQVGLGANANSYPNALSGGMQQRVGLARALAQDPDILLMDEAFSALDPLIRSEMQDELLKLQEDSDRTVVFISHDLDEAMRIGDRIAMMEGGRIVQIGSPDEILKNPADEYVRSFFRGVDPTTVLNAGDIVKDNRISIPRHKGEGIRAALERLTSADQDFGYVVDRQKRFQGVVSVDTLRENADQDGKTIEDAYLEGVNSVTEDTPLQDVLPLLVESPCPIPVVSEDQRYKGVISRNMFLRSLERTE